MLHLFLFLSRVFGGIMKSMAQIAPLLKNWEQRLCVNVGVHSQFVTAPLSQVTALSSTVRATISVKFGQWHDSTIWIVVCGWTHPWAFVWLCNLLFVQSISILTLSCQKSITQSKQNYQYVAGAAKEVALKNYFSIFSALGWNFKGKFYSLIYCSYVHISS